MTATDLSAEQMMEFWALRSVGKALTDPTTLSTGGSAGTDPERLIALYVEMVPGFQSAHEALRWVFILGRDPSEFQLKRPGENFGGALFRRGWGMHLGMDSRRVCSAVVEGFMCNLRARMEDSPFAMPEVHDEEETGQIVAQVDADGDREIMTW